MTRITKEKVARLIEGAELAGKQVAAFRLDGDVIELVFAKVATEAEEETGLNLKWGAK